MKQLFTLSILALLFADHSLSGQIISSDYTKVTTIKRSNGTHHHFPRVLVLNKDKSFLAILYGLKPPFAILEVYSTVSWEKVGHVQTNGIFNEHDSYFSGIEENVIHLARNSANRRKMLKVNFKTNEVTSYKLGKAQVGKTLSNYTPFYKAYKDYTDERSSYFFFDAYALTITSTTVEVFLKK